MSATIGVSMAPGQIALMRMPRGAYSMAALLVSPITPCLEAWYAARPGSPTRPPREEQLTMAPLPWVRIWPSSCFMQAHTPRRLIALTRSKTSAGFVGGVAGWNLDAGIVEGEVEPAEGFDGRLHHGRHTVLLGDVTPNTEDPVTGGWSAAFDGHLEVVGLLLDQLHRGVESSDTDDAVPVADIAVIEDQVARGGVVANVADVWVGSCRYAFHRQRPGKLRDLLDLVEVFEGQGERQLGGEVACRGVVRQTCGDHGIGDRDLERRSVGSGRQCGAFLRRRGRGWRRFDRLAG